ncbi:unnamed protein product [Prorocentrum cordatum]|uniref:Uncharacterized protein n=1 Tax=Prorocentrum cordatum TaxID=2364126 RepID=A0ABN9X3V3_9DINO|nr:unnamed protein product [Polarella glacialis]
MFWRCQLAPPPLQARTPRGCARGAGAWCMQIVGEDPAQRDGSAAVRARWHAWHSLPGDPAPRPEGVPPLQRAGRARSPRARGPPLARCPVATEAGTAAARSALHGRAPRPRLGPAPAPGSRGPVAVRELLLGPCLGRQFRGAMSLQDCARLSARSENLAEPLQRTRRNKKRKIEEMP